MMKTTKNETRLETTIHAYRFDLSKPDQAKAYDALCEKMKVQGTECFETWGGNSHYLEHLDGRKVELETAFVFDNQWNTAPIEGLNDKGYRVFDWAQDYTQDKTIKKGHYLDLTPGMIEVRANRLKCGYCGKQYDKRDIPAPPAFCHECLGSEYLKPEDLKLLRIGPVTRDAFEPLTAEESADLLPLYRAEQSGKGSERARKAREAFGARIKKEFDKKIAQETTEYNGKQWLFDRGCSLRLMENCIYYSHKGLFTFGWRNKLAAGEDLDWLLENLSEFPYEYTIETEHRGTLGGRE